MSNHTVSVGSTARAGWTMAFSGDKTTRDRGRAQIFDVIIQNTVFNVLNVGSLAYFAGKALGEDEDEEEFIQQQVLDSVGNSIPFLEHKTTKAKSDAQFTTGLGVKTFIDILAPFRGGLGAASSIGFFNSIGKKALFNQIAIAGGPNQFDTDAYTLSTWYDLQEIGGTPMIAGVNAMNWLTVYTGAREDYNLGHEDALLLLYQVFGFRESRSFMLDQLQKRNDVAVFKNQIRDDDEFGLPEGFKFFSTDEVDERTDGFF